MVEISLNFLVGLTTPTTMKLCGMLRPQEVMLIDSWATHNFISIDLVKKLAIPMLTTKGYGDLMETGFSVRGEWTCKGIVLSFHANEVVENFLPLKLSSPMSFSACSGLEPSIT